MRTPTGKRAIKIPLRNTLDPKVVVRVAMAVKKVTKRGTTYSMKEIKRHKSGAPNVLTTGRPSRVPEERPADMPQDVDLGVNIQLGPEHVKGKGRSGKVSCIKEGVTAETDGCPQSQADFLNDWLPHRSIFLKYLINAEAPTDERQCRDCKTVSAQWRCTDCNGRPSLCTGCCLERHANDFLHRIEEWIASPTVRRCPQRCEDGLTSINREEETQLTGIKPRLMRVT